MTLAELNGLPRERFVAELGAVFEHSPWVAERAFERRPFRSTEDLHRSMMDAMRGSSPDARLALVCAHPELAGAEANAGTLSVHSSGEQGRLGLTSLTAAEFKRISDLNRRYREKFGFPCIVALALHGQRSSVLDEMERRLANSRDAELGEALEQIGHIARQRLNKLVRE